MAVHGHPAGFSGRPVPNDLSPSHRTTEKSMRNPRLIRWELPLFLLLILACASKGAESLNERIDRLIAAGLPNFEREAAPVAGDEEFLRRIHLDLIGRIPSATEARDFLEASSPRKREKWIDRLLADPEHARHLQRVFDVLLMERRADVKVPRTGWEDYLRESFAANKPYDKLVREILSTDGADPKTRPAAKFLLERDLEPVLLTRDISRLFLGRNLQCAQCHDHPLVDDYKQDDFYSIQAFLNRAFLFPNAQAPTAVIAEKAEGEVSFTSVFDPARKQKTTPPRVLMGRAVQDPKPEKGKEYKVPPAKDVKPVPSYSRFARLAPAVASTENASFSRTAVNRVWAMLMGRGLVHPLDFDHPDNPPSHPQLLEMLAEEFSAKQFDLRWLIREIVLSKAYQRSSEPPPNLVSPIPEDRYLVAILKPLTAEQMAYSVLQATGFTDAAKLPSTVEATEPAAHAKLAPTAAPFVKIFAGRPGEPEEGFAATLDQALFVKHNVAIRNLISARAGNLLERCSKLADATAIADELFLSILTRRPAVEERKAIVDCIGNQKDRTAALSDVIWSLLASTEFRFNH